MKDPGNYSEIVETLEDVQVALDLLVDHLGVKEQVQSAISARRLKAEQSRLEIERSLGYADERADDSRR